MLTSWTRASSSFPLGPRLGRRVATQRTGTNQTSNRNLSKSNSARRSLIQVSSESLSSIVKKGTSWDLPNTIITMLESPNSDLQIIFILNPNSELSTNHWRDRNIMSRFKLSLKHRSFHSSRQGTQYNA